MGARFIPTCLALMLVLIGPAMAGAHGPLPPTPPAAPHQPWKDPLGTDDNHKPSWLITDQLSFPGGSIPAIDLGQPGLSFRYERIYGETEVPYFADTIHLNNPSGLGTMVNDVWIAECDGKRALKYSGSGAFMRQIGRAGVAYGTGTVLWCLRDMAEDSSGNIWVVDSAGHVARFDPSGNLLSDWGQIWNPGSANNRFDEPYSVALDSAGHVYISDSRNHRIQVYSASGVHQLTLGVTGVPGADNGHFNLPRHITIDANDHLFVADSGNHRVQVFNVTNVLSPIYVRTLGQSGVSGSSNSHFNEPQGVAVDLTRSRIYVADGYNFRIQIFDYASGSYVLTRSGISFPADVAVDATGRIYVALPWSDSNVVQQYDSNFNLLRTYGVTGVPYLTDNSHFFYPIGVAVANDGSIYIGEEAGRRLIKLNAAGQPVWVKGEPGWWGSDNEHFAVIHDVALDANGRVYVTDGPNCRVQIYNANGSYHATLGGVCGGGNYELRDPYGVTIAPNGDILVAERENHRVQIYNSQRVYLATIGLTATPTAGNAGFNQPLDVAVDSRGFIYVSDLMNHRVQVFDANRAYVRTIGTTGVPGRPFGQLSGPHHLAVDAHDNLYIADPWGNSRIQIHDSQGAYLATIDGAYGVRTGQNRGLRGVALDRAGNLYTADWDNARVKKYVSSVPGWRQKNIDGFGNVFNYTITSLTGFAGSVFAGTGNSQWETGAEIWRLAEDGAWTNVVADGFGDSTNRAIGDLAQFNGQLYAGTWNWECDDPSCTGTHPNGGQIWRSPTGQTWSQVVADGFGDPYNGEITKFAVFGGSIYAGVWSYSNQHSGEVWRSSTGNSGDWEQVVTNGFGNVNNRSVVSFGQHNGYLFAGTYNSHTGGEIWRTQDGIAWSQVNIAGFGDLDNYAASALETFQGSLYASTAHRSGAGIEVWRCQVCDGGDWSQVIDNGLGNPNTRTNTALQVFIDQIYLIAGNFMTGVEVWSSTDGATWRQIGFAGFGDSNNYASNWDNAVAVIGDRLLVGTYNFANGGEVWQHLHRSLYLPLLIRHQ